jgi:predicted AAA+ superfamily ATPase
MLRPELLIHNSHLESPELFDTLDPHLKRIHKQALQYRFPMLDLFPTQTEAVLALSGGRQVGKSTLVKQWMRQLLNAGVAPQQILYIPGELVDDHHQLVHLVSETRSSMNPAQFKYYLVDEVTYIDQWDKAIKFLVDSGFLERSLFLITGSDSAIIQQSMARFPGRRGRAPRDTFHLYPLSFRESVILKKGNPLNLIQTTMKESAQDAELARVMSQELNQYLIHGGFLSSMNDYVQTQSISDSTYKTYSDWIRGDMIKHGKNETFLREILTGILKHYGSQISWNRLTKELSIDHPKTVSEYIDLLSMMDAIFVQQALIEHKLAAAPKKEKKVFFSDPFIFHAVRAYLTNATRIFETQALKTIDDKDAQSKLIEACVVTHYRRYFPTYYIKAEGEVDIAYIKSKRIWPIEIKSSNQLRPKDLKQIRKYDNAIILSSNLNSSPMAGVPVENLAVHLWNMNF